MILHRRGCLTAAISKFRSVKRELPCDFHFATLEHSPQAQAFLSTSIPDSNRRTEGLIEVLQAMCGATTKQALLEGSKDEHRQWKRRSADVGGLRLAMGNNGQGKGWAGGEIE